MGSQAGMANRLVQGARELSNRAFRARTALAASVRLSRRAGDAVPVDDSLDAYVASWSRTHRSANVAVLAGPTSSDVGRVLDALAGARVRVFSPTTLPEWQLRRRGIKHVPVKHIGIAAWQFKRFGPFDAIINCAAAGKQGPFYAFQRLFFHLRAGGPYLQSRSVLSAGDWSRMLTALRRLPPLGAVEPDKGTPQAELAGALADVTVNRAMVVITKRNDHWLKLRGDEVDRFLRTRDVDATSRILSSEPECSFDSRADLDLHVSTTEPVDFPRTFDCPPLIVHAYSGDITMATHSLLYCDRTVLPESFRHRTVPVMGNSQLIDPSYTRLPGMAPSWSADFARVPDNMQAERSLPGDYYHLDCPYPGHFGHMMTEVISRLWGWELAKREFPGLKAILRVSRDDRKPGLATTLFRAYGITEEDITWVGEPVRLHSVVGATPMWQNRTPQYVHPGMLDVWRRLQHGLVEPDARTPEKIFISRTGDARRGCRNVAEVERYFSDRGYRIVYPETMDLARQATVFAGARVIAGFGGSAMFNMLFAQHLEKVIVLIHDSYVARNEYMFASVLGCQTHYVWSDPDIWQPEDHRSEEAFQSSWDFDFGRNLPILNAIT